ncbi:hypothetical protein P8452_11083 [Trifolium repens]|nr:hypothetical protein P8452_11083 [Trifolium repens]
MDNNIVDDVNVIESESKKCSSRSESEDENGLEEGEIVASDVRVNDDSEDDSEDITSWAIHDVESRQRSDRSRNHLEILINKALFPVLWFRVLIAVSLLLLRPANVV